MLMIFLFCMNGKTVLMFQFYLTLHCRRMFISLGPRCSKNDTDTKLRKFEMFSFIWMLAKNRCGKWIKLLQFLDGLLCDHLSLGWLRSKFLTCSYTFISLYKLQFSLYVKNNVKGWLFCGFFRFAYFVFESTHKEIV